MFWANGAHFQYECKKAANGKNIIKNYYLVNYRIAKNKYDYSFIFNAKNPEQVVLINLLPRPVRNYIKKKSTIANTLCNLKAD